MAERRIDGFFYGLFMDTDLLRESGVEAGTARAGYVDDFELRIGQRATLLPLPGARAYGMILELTHDDLDRLYGAPGLEMYRPEAVIARSMAGEGTPALCYNLVEAPAPNEANPEYAARLREVLARLGFPPDYVKSVE